MKWKKYWGMIPFIIYLVLKLSLLVIGSLTASSLRSVPKIVLFWFAMLSVLILIFWIGSMFFKWNRIKKFRGSMILKNIFLIIFAFGGFGAMVIGLFINVFTYEPEHIVERNGIRMVASVNSFLQETVYYYEYKNFLFHGKGYIGYEDYGNGGGDPIEAGREPNAWFFKDLDGNVIESGGEN